MDPVGVARAVVLRQLTGSARTRAELERALRKRDVPDDAARQVLDRFEELGYVDDASLAASWAKARVADRGLGRRALAARLRERGVEDEHVEAALADVRPEDEEAAARRLVRKRLAASPGLSSDVLERRLLSMLARKGHVPGLAYRLVREELAAFGQEQAAETPGWDDDGPGSEPAAEDGWSD